MKNLLRYDRSRRRKAAPDGRLRIRSFGLWQDAMREVAHRRDRQLTQGRRFAIKRQSVVSGIAGYTVLMVVAFALTIGWLNRDLVRLTASSVPADTIGSIADFPQATAHGVSFGLCHSGGGWNCVVDGDTFWLNGEKIRIADIDTPETHPSRCAREAELGGRATLRLQQLLNAGPIALAPAASGDTTDRYGRRLAVVERNGSSLGMTLVREGLARPYAGGSRAGWC